MSLRPVAFVRYDEQGAVTGWGFMSASAIAHEQAQGKRVIAGGDGLSDDFYVDGDAVLPKIDNPATLDGLTLHGVPVPATIIIDMKPYETDEATIELEFDFPGDHRVTVKAVRYLAKTFTVTA